MSKWIDANIYTPGMRSIEDAQAAKILRLLTERNEALDLLEQGLNGEWMRKDVEACLAKMRAEPAKTVLDGIVFAGVDNKSVQSSLEYLAKAVDKLVDKVNSL